METSRRRLIKLGLYATASLVTFEGLSGSVLAAAQKKGPAASKKKPPAEWPDSSWLRRDMFEALVGESFAADTPLSSTHLKLIAVEDALSARNAGTVGHPDCYVVVFEASFSTPKLKAGTYRVSSRALGEFVLFLVPGGATKQGVKYSATFNNVTA